MQVLQAVYSLVKKKSKKAYMSIEENKLYHRRYLRAINNPLRREILRTIKSGYETIRALQLSTGLDENTLKWHLNVLEYGCCIKKEKKQGKLIFKLTQEGRVVNYLE
jgi:predicted transcriptional regulator